MDLIITKGKRKKRAYIIGGVVAVVVVAIVVALVVVLTTGSSEEPAAETAGLTLEEILDGSLSPKDFNATWISDNKLLYKTHDGSLELFDVSNGSGQQIFPASALSNAVNFRLSPDEQFLLIDYDVQKLYRHTYLARYTILERATQREISLAEGQPLHYAAWGPVGNSIVYVANNNIFYKPFALGSSDDVVPVTEDGREGFIYNGVPDWVYEEEVFGSNNALWFSPDGRKLAYVKFNDNATEVMSIPFYGTPGSLDSQYTKAIQIRYPKPGTRNPDASLHVYDLELLRTYDLGVPSGLTEEIITAVTWATDNVVCAIWLNRVQNEAYVTTYDVSSFASAANLVVVSHIQQQNGWLNLFTPPIFSKDGSQLLLVLSQNQGGNVGSYRHVTRFNRVANSPGIALTSGRYVVSEILGWNDTLIYYTANTEEDPAVLHLYSFLTTNNTITCITCDVTTTIKNEECLYNSATFSKDFSFYFLSCAGPGVPEISLFSGDHSRLMVWEDNKELIDALENKEVPEIVRFYVDIADGFTAQVALKLPPNIDVSGNTKYPMVVNVYGGPDSYQVVRRFGFDWGSYLAANKSIIYAMIDGRGSGLKGDKMMFAGYRNLGTVEIEDQINVTRHIQQTVPYVDGSRTAIWGWSYGGYAAGLALAKDTNGIFKCGMSVAPVTDWTLYDSIYTERYMGLPRTDDNIQGYEDAKLLNLYNGIRGKEYFLVHGTFDDNVHYQQSMLWSKVLEHQDIMFRQQSYPDEDHSLYFVRPHLYHSLENFLDECFIENV